MIKKYIVFDIGGTFIKWAILDSEFTIIKKERFLYNNELNDGLWLINEISKISKEMSILYKDLIAVGVSTAGDVNTITTEIIGSTPNHRNYTGQNFKKIFLKTIDLPLYIDNDANCAALGEAIKGGLINTKYGIVITLGTDIGGGIILNGKVFHGFNGSAGEVGYMNVLGRRWGTYFSAKGLSLLVKEKFDLELKDYQILESSNKELKKVINYWYEGLAIGISNLIAIFNPEIILIGGGLSESGLLDLQQIKMNVDSHLIEKHLKNSCNIEISKLGNDASLYGVCEMINTKLKKN